MYLKKKWFTILFTIIAISILTACGDSGETGGGTSQDAGVVQENSYDFMPLSDALEKYSLWFKVEGDPYELTRNSVIDDIFVFENDTVKQYRVRWLKLEDVIDMSDDEIIEAVIDRLHENNEDYEEPEPIEYTLDITLDAVGKDTEYINVETIPETVFSVINETAFQTIFDTPFSGLVYNQEDRSDWDEHIITRVEDESILFTLDDSNTQKSNVTIENTEIGKLRKEYNEKLEEERRIAREESITPEERYMSSCAFCHGSDLSGAGGPQLSNIGSKLSEEEIYDIIVNGKGAMPGGTAENDKAALQLAEWLSEMK